MKKAEKDVLDSYLIAEAEMKKAEAVIKANREQVIALLKANGNLYQNKDVGFITLSEVVTRSFNNAFIDRIPSDKLAEVTTVAIAKVEKIMDVTGCFDTKLVNKISFKAA
jgi:hypothetical protein